MGRGDISMNNPERNRIERNLENKFAPPSINSIEKATFNFHKLTRQLSEVLLAKLPTKEYLNRTEMLTNTGQCFVTLIQRTQEIHT